MQTNDLGQGRVRQTINDLILAEMFLLQATVESAAVIGDGLNELGRQVTTGSATEKRSWDAIRALLQRTANQAIEPYTSRLRYLQDMTGGDALGKDAVGKDAVGKDD